MHIVAQPNRSTPWDRGSRDGAIARDASLNSECRASDGEAADPSASRPPHRPVPGRVQRQRLEDDRDRPGLSHARGAGGLSGRLRTGTSKDRDVGDGGVRATTHPLLPTGRGLRRSRQQAVRDRVHEGSGTSSDDGRDGGALRFASGRIARLRHHWADGRSIRALRSRQVRDPSGDPPTQPALTRQRTASALDLRRDRAGHSDGRPASGSATGHRSRGSRTP